eukprot:10965983-Lingulodinium_polyedra.AAC.1
MAWNVRSVPRQGQRALLTGTSPPATNEALACARGVAKSRSWTVSRSTRASSVSSASRSLM